MVSLKHASSIVGIEIFGVKTKHFLKLLLHQVTGEIVFELDWLVRIGLVQLMHSSMGLPPALSAMFKLLYCLIELVMLGSEFGELSGLVEKDINPIIDSFRIFVGVLVGEIILAIKFFVLFFQVWVAAFGRNGIADGETVGFLLVYALIFIGYFFGLVVVVDGFCLVVFVDGFIFGLVVGVLVGGIIWATKFFVLIFIFWVAALDGYTTVGFLLVLFPLVVGILIAGI